MGRGKAVIVQTKREMGDGNEEGEEEKSDALVTAAADCSCRQSDSRTVCARIVELSQESDNSNTTVVGLGQSICAIRH